MGLYGLTSGGLAADLEPLPGTAVEKDPAFLLSVMYTGEGWHNDGGSDTGETYMHGLDVALAVDAEKAFGWRGARFYFEGFYVAGTSLTLDYTAAFNAPSVLDAYYLNDEVVRLYQAYYGQSFGATDIIIGLYDLQQHFANTRPMDLFNNRAFALNMPLFMTSANFPQVNFNGPSMYPNTSFGTRIKHEFNDQWTAKVGVLNGVADDPTPPWHNEVRFSSENGALIIGEISYTPQKYTEFMVGAWGMTGKFIEFGPTSLLGPIAGLPVPTTERYGTSGVYAGATHRLYTFEGRRGIDGFINAGYADPDVSAIEASLGFGLTFTGLFDVRPNDKLGVAYNIDWISEPYQGAWALLGGGIPDNSSIFEVTYRAPINDWLTVQPTFQYIADQASQPNHEDAYVFGLHFEIGNVFKF